MRYLIIAILITYCTSGSPIDQDGGEFFSKNGIEGVIFKEPYPTNYVSDSNWFTPNVQEVLGVDSMIFTQNFKELGGASREVMIDNCPIIANNWDKFYRQVIGTKNDKGQHVLVLNYFWKADTLKFPDWKNEKVDMMGGCSYYWSVKFNMKKNKSFDLWVN